MLDAEASEAKEKTYAQKVLYLLSENNRLLKENNDIIKKDHAVILNIDEILRKIKINTQ